MLANLSSHVLGHTRWADFLLRVGCLYLVQFEEKQLRFLLMRRFARSPLVLYPYQLIIGTILGGLDEASPLLHALSCSDFLIFA